MKTITTFTLGLLVAGFVSTDAGTSYAYEYSNGTTTQVAGGAFLTGGNGMSLYTFDKDAKGKSNCYDGCAGSWPPYIAQAGDTAPGKGFSLVKRRDGTQQWAKDGKPLYFWAGDSRKGDTNGDGVGGVWHLAH